MAAEDMVYVQRMMETNQLVKVGVYLKNPTPGIETCYEAHLMGPDEDKLQYHILSTNCDGDSSPISIIGITHPCEVLNELESLAITEAERIAEEKDVTFVENC